MTTRRRFLKAFGIGAVGSAAAVLPGCAIPADKDADERVAFNFTCVCGKNLIAEVPKEKGTVVNVKCGCRREWKLRWEGDHFQTSMVS